MSFPGAPLFTAAGRNLEHNLMNTYIASLNSMTIGTIVDTPDHHSVVMDTLSVWLQAGASVHLSRNGVTAPVKVVEPAPVAVAVARPAPKKVMKKHAPKAKSDPASIWSIDDTVYLKWSALAYDIQVHLSTYRQSKGVVADFRMGIGAQKTVGVRFGNDPELIWLRPAELVGSPEVGL